jgi:hypothetical protein
MCVVEPVCGTLRRASVARCDGECGPTDVADPPTIVDREERTSIDAEPPVGDVLLAQRGR